MPFTLLGSDISLYKPTDVWGGTKFDIQFETTTQNPVFVDDQSHAVLSLIYEYRGKYWADQAGTRGSLLWTIKDDRKSAPSQSAGYVRDALQPLIDHGKISNVSVTATRPFPGRINLNINYSLPTGQTVNLRPSIGY